MTDALASQILSRGKEYTYEVYCDQMNVKSDIQSQKNSSLKEVAASVRANLSEDQQYAMDLAIEKGASTWLTALPIKAHGFTLHKGDFRDALMLRYGWTLPHCPSYCSCRAEFSVEHSLSCPKGGFPTIRHNEVRDLTASLLTEVCHDFGIEPSLQPLDGEEFATAPTTTYADEARLDVVARGFWQDRGERSFYNVQIFNPHAPTNKTTSISGAYFNHEQMKKRLYMKRINDIELSSFTPLVFSLSGGMGKEASQFYKRLASLLSTRWEQPYSVTLGWLRCCLSFSLLQSSILSIRGFRSCKGHFAKFTPSPIDLIRCESNFII